MPAQKKSKLKARDKVEEKLLKKKWQSPSSAGTSFNQCTLVGSFKIRQLTGSRFFIYFLYYILSY